MVREKNHKLGFTLIELLIVVAIIAILAAIAVPNFLEAQTRSKVSRVRADMRSLETALESYAVDWNRYPVIVAHLAGSNVQSFEQRLAPLTSPVAYITTLPGDPFPRGAFDGSFFPDQRKDIYAYNTSDFGPGRLTAPGSSLGQLSWSLLSGGPDNNIQFPYYAYTEPFVSTGRYILFVYDPTNGAISDGDIVRRGGQALVPLPGVD